MPPTLARANCLLVVLALAAVLAALPGCGKGRKVCYPVRGKILIDDKPGTDCFIYFHPADEGDPDRVCPYGQADEQGEFVLSSYVEGDGAPAGEYLVTFQWPRRSGLLKDKFDDSDRLDRRYYKPKESKFRIRIEKGSYDLEPFNLSTKPAK
jgi:hypothetical protein